MKRRTSIALGVIAVVLLCIAGYGYLYRQRMRHQYVMLIEEATTCISINCGSAEELESLPGIGPHTAQSIIEYREAHGPFPTLDALKDVKGIGDAIYERVAPYIRL